MHNKLEIAYQGKRALTVYYLEEKNKTILLTFRKDFSTDFISDILSSEGYRLIRANNFLSLIDSLERFHIHLIISEAKLPCISMSAFIPFLRKRYPDIKVIIVMKEYSPLIELSLRPHKLLYIMSWPVSNTLLKSVVAKGLEKSVKGLISA